MANGTQARSMEELKDNFDTASVVGYFMEGKLETWLNDRYYEEEAAQVAALSKDDPALAQKLCAVFGVACAAEDGVDPEEIAYRQERLNRLKQYTDDETLWAQVDKVAFDQEDLADLYDAGVEPIYLCAGNFKIPKSKQGLRYIAIAGAVAEGVQLTQPEQQEEPAPAVTAQPKFEVKLSGDRLMKIAADGEKTELAKNVKCFTSSDKYVFAVTDGTLCRIEMLTNKKTQLPIENAGCISEIVCTDSLLIWSNGSAIMKCDHDGDFLEKIASDSSFLFGSSSFDNLCINGSTLYCVKGRESPGGKRGIIITIALETGLCTEWALCANFFCIAENTIYAVEYRPRKGYEPLTDTILYQCDLNGTNQKVLDEDMRCRPESIHYNNGSIFCRDYNGTVIYEYEL